MSWRNQGTTDRYRELSQCLAKYDELIQERGGRVETGVEIKAIRGNDSGHLLETTTGEIEAGFLINCGGLHSDRIAQRAGVSSNAEIAPFRGEYYELVLGKRHFVRGLIYPVPNPGFPFLGVHFAKMIDGSVHAGPNAVLVLKREGYRKTDLNCVDLLETLTYRGFWKLARRHYKEGIMEIYRSLSKKAFARNLQQIIPEVDKSDLVPTHSGVRAQALSPDGQLGDDFLIVNGRNSIHLCNAPSPAATASLEIGNRVPELR